MPTPRDWRKNPEPRMMSIQIIIDLVKKGVDEFTSTQVSKYFKISPAEACTRLNVLRRYGCVKIATPKSYPRVYQITDWGRKYSKFKSREMKIK